MCCPWTILGGREETRRESNTVTHLNWNEPMRRLALLFLLSLGLATAVQGRQDVPAAESVAGAWTGSISVPGRALDVTVLLANSAAAGWTGTIDIPAQGAKGLALDRVVVDGRAISFHMRGVPGDPAFAGQVSDDGTRMSGTFAQNGATLPFALTRGAPKAPNRPQEPKPPFPYRTEDVRFRNATAGIQLAGTLTLPSSSRPAPAVLLISGSGAQDRDETIFDHKPFLVLADHLTRAGFAVLRVDDRGVGGSDRGPAGPTTEDFVGDVLAGVAYLGTRPEIDGRRIGLIGHSEGATIAPMAAVRSSDVAFIVMLAGTGVPGDQVLMSQVEALGRIQGVSSDLMAWDRSMRQRVYELVKSETGGVPDDVRRRALLDGIAPVPGAPDATSARTQATVLLNASSVPWFRFFLAYDPRPTLQRVKCPVLALGGSLDVQVVADQNLPSIETALRAGGNPDVTVKKLPGLNHLFQSATTGGVDEYVTIEETIAPVALQAITDWLEKRK